MMNDLQEPSQQENLTVLDWFRSILRGKPIPIPDEATSAPAPEAEIQIGYSGSTVAIAQRRSLRDIRIENAHLRLPVGLFLAFAAQITLSQRVGTSWISLVVYIFAAFLVGWSVWAGDYPFPEARRERDETVNLGVRLPYLVAGLAFSALTLLTASENMFRSITLLSWLLAVGTLLAAFWEGEISGRAISSHIRELAGKQVYRFEISQWSALLVGVMLIAAFLRFSQLSGIPGEMWSDHAEKLLDVQDVLDGQYSIFFPRNTGREAIQFYLAAWTANLVGTGISFDTLKIGTALLGFLTLPFIYLFAAEIGGRRIGLLALFLAGFAFWPNAISRVGLRFPLYPFFVAPAFFFFLYGLRRKNRNALLLSGLAIGLSLQGYSPARALPIAIFAGMILYLVHSRDREARIWSLFVFGMLLILSLSAALPLIRVTLEMPEVVGYRMLTRVTQIEQAFPQSPLLTLGKNFLDGFLMFGWDSGGIWIIVLPGRPLLDWVSSAAFYLGLITLVVRYLQTRDWRYLFLLLSIPILILPSVLSIAFPAENPAPNRAAGAIVPVFTVAAFPLVMLFQWATKVWPARRGRVVGVVLVGLLVWIAASANSGVLFGEFAEQHRRNSWNTSEAGRVIRNFSEATGSFDTAYVIPYPHWMDTRLVGIAAGAPRIDFALPPDQMDRLAEETRAQLFLIKPEDTDTQIRLAKLFPNGVLTLFEAEVDGRDFFIYLVPPSGDTISLDLEN